MGLFNLSPALNIPLYAGTINGDYENLGMIEGMYEYSSDANRQSNAVEKAKTELRRNLKAMNADAAINVKFACLSSNNVCTILVYGDAIKLNH